MHDQQTQDFRPIERPASSEEPQRTKVRGSMERSFFVDPLLRDVPDDEIVTVTRRGIARVALVAAETAIRFERQEVVHEPIAWMMTGRRMFGGAAALDACLGRTECVRALALHAEGTKLDDDPDELDELIAGWDGGNDDSEERSGYGLRSVSVAAQDVALYSTTAVEETEEGLVHVFEAVVANSRAEAEALFLLRHGARMAAGAEMIRGFRSDIPLVAALVSPAMGDMLAQVARAPDSPLAHGLHVAVEQRFAS